MFGEKIHIWEHPLTRFRVQVTRRLFENTGTVYLDGKPLSSAYYPPLWHTKFLNDEVLYYYSDGQVVFRIPDGYELLVGVITLEDSLVKIYRNDDIRLHKPAEDDPNALILSRLALEYYIIEHILPTLVFQYPDFPSQPDFWTFVPLFFSQISKLIPSQVYRDYLLGSPFRKPRFSSGFDAQKWIKEYAQSPQSNEIFEELTLMLMKHPSLEKEGLSELLKVILAHSGKGSRLQIILPHTLDTLKGYGSMLLYRSQWSLENYV